MVLWPALREPPRCRCAGPSCAKAWSRRRRPTRRRSRTRRFGRGQARDPAPCRAFHPPGLFRRELLGPSGEMSSNWRSRMDKPNGFTIRAEKGLAGRAVRTRFSSVSARRRSWTGSAKITRSPSPRAAWWPGGPAGAWNCAPARTTPWRGVSGSTAQASWSCAAKTSFPDGNLADSTCLHAPALGSGLGPGPFPFLPPAGSRGGQTRGAGLSGFG